MQDYQITEFLSNGAFGRVYKAKHTTTGDVVVIKRVELDHAAEESNAMNEIDILDNVKHKFIIPFRTAFVSEDTHGQRTTRSLNIVLDYAEGGDLYSKMKERARMGIPFKERTLWKYIFQIAAGLQYLYSQRVLHRDIKLHNILLSANDDVMIGDLGLGRILGNMSVLASTNVGTPLYMSPELCKGLPYDEKSDMWAFGCLIYELITFKPPFKATNTIALANKICKKKPDHPLSKMYSKDLRCLVVKLLSKDPEKRMSVDRVLSVARNKHVDASADESKNDHWLEEKHLLEKENALLRQQISQLQEDLQRCESKLRRYQDSCLCLTSKKTPRRKSFCVVPPSPHLGRARRIPIDRVS